MPVYNIEKLNDDCIWGIWKIDGEESLILEDLVHFSYPESFSKISHPRKKLEWLSSRLLVKAMMEFVQKPFYGLQNDDNGKPYLKNSSYHISLSHCGDYSVAILNKQQRVGIDLELAKSKLFLVMNKFLHPEEKIQVGDNLSCLCIYWCVKEVLYKIHGTKKISLKNNIRVHPFDYNTLGGVCFADLLLDGGIKTFNIRYLLFENYYIAFNI